MSLTRELVTRVRELEYEDLTDEDLAATRRLLFDHLGVAANGSGTESARAMQRFAGAADRREGFPIIGTNLRVDPLRAAMANAVAAHSIEYDDVHNAASSHPGVVVFPAAMAAAEISGAKTRGFLLGVAVGYEVMCRVGRAANPPSHYARHFHPTGTTGHFGATAAAASILELDADTTVSALGIAATMAAGSMQFLRDGALHERRPRNAIRTCSGGPARAPIFTTRRQAGPSRRRFSRYQPITNGKWSRLLLVGGSRPELHGLHMGRVERRTG